MARQRTYTDSALIQAVETSTTYAEVLRKLGLRPGGGTKSCIVVTVARLGVDTSHFTGVPKKTGKPALSFESILVEGSTYNCTSTLKNRLVVEGLLQYKCHDPRCSLSNEWNGTPLVLHLDHINGVNTDNRLGNLRLLCPNCHSQTHTYSGRNMRSRPLKENFCACGTQIGLNNLTCRPCRVQSGKASTTQLQRQGVAWPPNDELRTLVWQQSVLQIAKTIGVSDKAVQKHCLRHGIPTPPRGYWAKQRALK